jgi:hypothetical protein
MNLYSRVRWTYVHSHFKAASRPPKEPAYQGSPHQTAPKELNSGTAYCREFCPTKLSMIRRSIRHGDQGRVPALPVVQYVDPEHRDI